MSSNDLSILVVDDLESGRLMIQSALEKAGYTDIRLAESAYQALDLLKQRRADVMLADWVMPQMDGLELTNHVRQLDEDLNHYTSIVMFTAKEGVAHLVNAFDQGVDDYLNKPLNEMELAARVFAAGRISSLQNTLLETTRAMSELNTHLNEIAHTDPLTDLGNRRYLQDHLEAAVQETLSRSGATACAMIDIDYFKKINDQYGHDIGDEILVGFAKRLRRAVRPTDILARMGGEEFAIVMHFNQPDNFKPSIFDRIQKTLSGRALRTSVANINVTVSLGACHHTGADADMTPEKLLKCADEKLYEAKQAGRNMAVY